MEAGREIFLISLEDDCGDVIVAVGACFDRVGTRVVGGGDIIADAEDTFDSLALMSSGRVSEMAIASVGIFAVSVTISRPAAAILC